MNHEERVKENKFCLTAKRYRVRSFLNRPEFLKQFNLRQYVHKFKCTELFGFVVLGFAGMFQQYAVSLSKQMPGP